MKSALNEKLKVLKQKGHFLTSSRLIILEYLLSTKSHPTADEIYLKLKSKLPSLSKATVYNTLKLFSETGIVREIKVEKGKNRFEARTDPHVHFICIKCHRVHDIEKQIAKIPKTVEEHKVMFGDIFLYGICSSCRKEGSS